MQGDTVFDILSRVIKPEIGDLSPAVAKEFSRYRIAERDHIRMVELDQKSAAGELTPEEQSEHNFCRAVAAFVDLVNAKAQLSLKVQASDQASRGDPR